MIDYVLVHTGFMGPANLVALMIAELDNTLPFLQDVHQDSVWATCGFPSRYHVEDIH
jgi:hypothetical protein